MPNSQLLIPTALVVAAIIAGAVGISVDLATGSIDLALATATASLALTTQVGLYLLWRVTLLGALERTLQNHTNLTVSIKSLFPDGVPCICLPAQRIWANSTITSYVLLRVFVDHTNELLKSSVNFTLGLLMGSLITSIYKAIHVAHGADSPQPPIAFAAGAAIALIFVRVYHPLLQQATRNSNLLATLAPGSAT